MRHDKLERELYLLRLLAENNCYTVDDLCQRVGISRRNFYYYIEFFKDSGFHVSKRGGYIRISRDSPFFAHLIERVSFTEEEALVLRHLLENARQGNVLVANIKKKLDRFYDFDILSDEQTREQTVQNIHNLYDAIKLRRYVILRNYTSPHSRSTKDRLVEPFMLMNNNNEVRCFEPASGMNKTFKASRMQSVEVLDTEWNHASEHRQMFTDVFMFSGEERLKVSLLLDSLAYNVLVKEYPQTKEHITPQPDGRHLFTAELCSYVAIGRFALGLFSNIEVLGDPPFKAYLREKVEQMASKAGPLSTP